MSFLRSIFNYWSKRIYRKIYFNTLSNITDHVSNNFIWIWQNKIFTKLAWNINLKIKQTLDQSILLILHKQLFTIIIQIIDQSIIHIIPNIILTKIKKIPPPILRLSSNDWHIRLHNCRYQACYRGLIRNTEGSEKRGGERERERSEGWSVLSVLWSVGPRAGWQAQRQPTFLRQSGKPVAINSRERTRLSRGPFQPVSAGDTSIRLPEYFFS